MFFGVFYLELSVKTADEPSFGSFPIMTESGYTHFTLFWDYWRTKKMTFVWKKCMLKLLLGFFFL